MLSTKLIETVRQPWIIFLVLALIAQQGNLLTYRFGAYNANPYVFMMYSFASQSIVSFILMLFFKNKGFPIRPFKKNMWFLALFLIVVYSVNELILIHVYSLGAPFSLMMAVFAVVTLVFMTSFAFLFLKETLSMRKLFGIILAIISIITIRLG